MRILRTRLANPLCYFMVGMKYFVQRNSLDMPQREEAERVLPAFQLRTDSLPSSLQRVLSIIALFPVNRQVQLCLLLSTSCTLLEAAIAKSIYLCMHRHFRNKYCLHFCTESSFLH